MSASDPSIEFLKQLENSSYWTINSEEGETTLGFFIKRVFGESSDYWKEFQSIQSLRYVSEKSKKFVGLVKALKNEIAIYGIPHRQASGIVDTSSESKPVLKADLQRVFIVHGHDGEMKQAVARSLEKLGLTAIILHEQPSKGRTIIQKFKDYSDVGFAVVLLSPDDIAFSKDDTVKNAKARARQNVIFELGFFIGHLGSDRVFTLYKDEENLELPSDYAGVLYTPFDGAGQWRFDLVKELKSAGYNVDANKLV